MVKRSETRIRLVHAVLAGVFITWSAFSTQAAEVGITQKDMQFTPHEVVLGKGDVLVFTNLDTTTHNIQVVNADGDAVDKGLQRPGEIVKHVFAEPGSYQVRCQIHPDMMLTVTVK
jgi:plastocyanin